MPSEKASDGISWRKKIKPIYCYRQFIHNTRFKSSIFLHTEYINTQNTKAASICFICLISQTALPLPPNPFFLNEQISMIKETLMRPIFLSFVLLPILITACSTPDKSARWENIGTISNGNIHTYINKDSVRKTEIWWLSKIKKLLPI